MSPHPFIRGISYTSAGAVAVAASALVWTGSAHASADIFDLSSEAVAVESTVTDPGIPLGIPFSVGSYGAGAVLNSNGASAADAGAPYSPLVSSLPNTGNGVAQSSFGYGLPVVPTFPGYVSARDPVTPAGKQNAGGYELAAKAQPTSSSGQVSMGGQAALSAQNNAFAIAEDRSDSDGVLAEGSAGVHALTLDGIMDLANVSSYAGISRGADNQPVAVTRTNLGTVSFAGLASGLTDRGLSTLGSKPTPLSADGLASVNDALKPSGIRLTYLPEVYNYTDGSTTTGATPNAHKEIAGVTSGALQIFLSNTSDRGTTTETITIGRVSISATSSSLKGVSAALVAAGPATGTGAAATGGALSSPAVGGSAGLLPEVGTPPAPQPVGGATPRVPVTTRFLPAAAAADLVGEGTTSFKSFYLVLAVLAAVGLVGARAVRFLGVGR
jgi:hypothetical protein